MFYPASPSPLAKLSLWTVAIVGSLLSAAPRPAASLDAHLMQFTSPPPAAEQTDAPEVNGLAVMAIALAGSAAIGVGLNALLDHKPSAQRSVASSDRAGAASLDRVSQPLRRKLFRLLHDDRAAADRLVAQASLKYPGKAPDWYVEKVIFDLERDRGRY